MVDFTPIYQHPTHSPTTNRVIRAFFHPLEKALQNAHDLQHITPAPHTPTIDHTNDRITIYVTFRIALSDDISTVGLLFQTTYPLPSKTKTKFNLAIIPQDTPTTHTPTLHIDYTQEADRQGFINTVLDALRTHLAPTHTTIGPFIQ